MTDELDEAPALQEQPDRPDWFERAECRGVDPDLFFPKAGESYQQAQRVCRECPVRAQCLEYALDNCERFGVWGGLTERERRQLRRTRHLNLVVNGLAS